LKHYSPRDPADTDAGRKHSCWRRPELSQWWRYDVSRGCFSSGCKEWRDGLDDSRGRFFSWFCRVAWAACDVL